MHLSITGHHVELTPALKRYVEDKLHHLRHSFDQVVRAHVVLSVEKFRQSAEVTLHANGQTLHAKHETEDMYASIDGVMDKINRQLKRYRAKGRPHQSQHAQRTGRELKAAQALNVVENDELAQPGQG